VRRRDLVAHLRSLEQIFAETTVAPCSFGTVLESRAAVERDFLAPRRKELAELLDRLEGKVQMNVKAEYEEESVMRAIVSEDAEVVRVRERARALGAAGHYENIRLGELVAANLAARRARDADHIAETLGATATDVVAEPAAAEGLGVFKGYFLVARESLPAFDDALEQLAGEPLRIDSFGPLPPTAFAGLDRS
jgi:hypothetical protein